MTYSSPESGGDWIKVELDGESGPVWPVWTLVYLLERLSFAVWIGVESVLDCGLRPGMIGSVEKE